MIGHGQHPADGTVDRRIRDTRIFLDNLEDLAARTRPDRPLPGPVDIEGTDSTGTIRARVDLAGTLIRIEVGDDWWDRLGPELVATAILEAVRFAKSTASMARLTLDRYGHRPERPAPELDSVFAPGAGEPLPDWDSPDLPQALSRKLDRALTVLDNAEKFSRDRDASGERVVTGPHRLFRLILRGQEIRSAEVDRLLLHRSDGPVLAEDARAALRAVNPATPLAHASTQEDR